MNALMSDGVHLPRIDLDEPLLLECRDFLECIEKRDKPVSDGKQGYEVVRILEKIDKTMKSRKAKS